MISRRLVTVIVSFSRTQSLTGVGFPRSIRVQGRVASRSSPTATTSRPLSSSWYTRHSDAPSAATPSLVAHCAISVVVRAPEKRVLTRRSAAKPTRRRRRPYQRGDEIDRDSQPVAQVIRPIVRGAAGRGGLGEPHGHRAYLPIADAESGDEPRGPAGTGAEHRRRLAGGEQSGMEVGHRLGRGFGIGRHEVRVAGGINDRECDRGGADVVQPRQRHGREFVERLDLCPPQPIETHDRPPRQPPAGGIAHGDGPDGRACQRSDAADKYGRGAVTAGIVRPLRRAAGWTTAEVTNRSEGTEQMWAQLITTRLKPGREQDLAGLVEQLRASEQPDSGLVRSLAMHDQKDPSRIYMLVVFESEARARGAKVIHGAKKGCRPRGPRWRRSSTALPSSST